VTLLDGEALFAVQSIERLLKGEALVPPPAQGSPSAAAAANGATPRAQEFSAWLNEVNSASGAQDAANAVWAQMRYNMDNDEMRVLEVFREIDKDRNGTIDAIEFAAALTRIGIHGTSAKVIKAIMSTADTNGDGKIEYKELARALKAAPQGVTAGHGSFTAPSSPPKGNASMVFEMLTKVAKELDGASGAKEAGKAEVARLEKELSVAHAALLAEKSSTEALAHEIDAIKSSLKTAGITALDKGEL